MSVDASAATWRRELSGLAELSGRERQTGAFIAARLHKLGAARVVTDLGGCGVAGVWEADRPGKVILLRAELDALPALGGAAAHTCGHDGHMAVLLEVARRLSLHPLELGRAILLFQPAEETGEGAAKVLSEPRFAELSPDFVLAFHNLPGLPLGSVVLKDGVFAAASVGIEIELKGATSHASQPQAGRSPAAAACQLGLEIPALPQRISALHEAALATVIHINVGERAFGTTPGHAVVCATLRAYDDSIRDKLQDACFSLGHGLAAAYGLEVHCRAVEPFPATSCASWVVSSIHSEARAQGLEIVRACEPFPWSEDFGHFTARYPGALFGLGAGIDCPALHHPSYEFPDELLEPAATLMEGLLRRQSHAGDGEK